METRFFWFIGKKYHFLVGALKNYLKWTGFTCARILRVMLMFNGVDRSQLSESQKNVFGDYLARLGSELSDRLPIGAVIIAPERSLREPGSHVFGSVHDLHGIFPLWPDDGEWKRLIHARTYYQPTGSLREIMLQVQLEATNGPYFSYPFVNPETRGCRIVLAELLPMRNYGHSVEPTAERIVSAYKSHVDRIDDSTLG
jgi:hypothetical protein